MVQVQTVFDCRHERELSVQIENDVVIPDQVRGIGKCPQCRGGGEYYNVAGIAPQSGGKELVLDTIMIMPS